MEYEPYWKFGEGVTAALVRGLSDGTLEDLVWTRGQSLDGRMDSYQTELWGMEIRVMKANGSHGIHLTDPTTGDLISSSWNAGVRPAYERAAAHHAQRNIPLMKTIVREHGLE